MKNNPKNVVAATTCYGPGEPIFRVISEPFFLYKKNLPAITDSEVANITILLLLYYY